MIIATVLFLLYLLFVTAPGYVILRSLVRDEKNAFILASLSVFIGLSLFLFGLNLVLYVAPFSLANKLLLPLYFACFAIAGKKLGLLKLGDCEWEMSPSEKKIFGAVAAVVVGMFALLIWGTFYADNLIHTSLAISMLNGNIHPLKWPWYPNYHYSYHYGYDLMKSSTQDFCGINQFYSDKAWYLIQITGLFSFLVALVKRGMNSFKAGLCAGLCFLFFCGISTFPMIDAVVKLAHDALHQTSKTTYEALIELYKAPPFIDISFFPHSLHKPMLMRFPVYLAFIYLFVRGPKRERLDAPYLLVSSCLLGFLCLCDESLFGLTGLAVGMYVLLRAWWTEPGQKLRFLGHGLAILILGGILGLIEGGFLTTTFFHGHEMYADGSHFAQTGGYGKLLLRDRFYFFLHPLFTLDRETWAFYGSSVLIPMICFVALQWRTLRQRHTCMGEWKEIFIILCLTFWVGFLFAGVFTVMPSDLAIVARMYVWPILCLCTGAIVAVWVEERFDRKGLTKLGRWLLVLLMFVLLAGTLLRIGTGCVISAAFQFSNEKKNMAKRLAFGEWLRRSVPRDAITFGIDVRYTGLFSYGGNQFLDAVSIPKSELETYEKAKTIVDYAFLRRNKVTHLVVDRDQYRANATVLADKTRFQEIEGPYSKDLRVFRLLP